MSALRRPPRQRQQGVAIITALLLTTLSITIVASLFWQQQVQVRSMENQRLHLQTKWIQRGALDWARLVLRQDGFDNQNYTTLSAVWNTPLAETRLDQYIERERVEGEVFDATLSGRILDAEARFNLTNLSEGRVIDKRQLAIFKRLLRLLQLDSTLGDKVALAVASSGALPPKPLMGADAPPETIGQPPPGTSQDGGVTGGGAGDPNAQQGGQVQGVPVPLPSNGAMPIAMTRVDDLLAVPGFTPQMVDKLREFLIVLPERNLINVNTAPPEVLAALVEGMSLSEGQALASRRTQAYFRQNSDYEAQVFNTNRPEQGTYDVTSEYFLVLSRIRLDRAALDAQALVNRKLGPGARTTTIWVRQN
jgi:general secretion pathway protein K